MDIENRLERLEAFDIPNQNLDTNSDVLFGQISLTDFITGTNYYTASYTPTWTAVTSGTVLGNGTLTGRYTVIGRLCYVSVQLDFGSSTKGGFNVWEFTLPVTPSTDLNRFVIGSAFALDSGVADYIGACRMDNNTNLVRVFFQTGSVSNSGRSNYPMIWGSADTLTWSLVYEV